jgi:hypothetical protein
MPKRFGKRTVVLKLNDNKNSELSGSKNRSLQSLQTKKAKKVD